MREESKVYSLKHPFAVVASASWRKYPHQDLPHVVRADVVERRIDEETGVLHTTRLITVKERQMPWWLKRVFGSGPNHIWEESEVDPVANTMVLRATNVSYRSLLKVQESCYYSIDPEDATRTQFRQTTHITALPMGVGSQIENFITERFHKNAAKGRAVLHELCDMVTVEFDKMGFGVEAGVLSHMPQA